MTLIGRCSDCREDGIPLYYKPDVDIDQQRRPSVCDYCRDQREENVDRHGVGRTTAGP